MAGVGESVEGWDRGCGGISQVQVGEDITGRKEVGGGGGLSRDWERVRDGVRQYVRQEYVYFLYEWQTVDWD